MTYNIAIELGSSNTAIYLEGNGVVYYQPTTVAFLGEKKARNVIAVGKTAKQMQGKSPEKTVVIDPVENGVIRDPEAAMYMLRTVLHDLLPPTVLQPRIHAILLIPCGLPIEERKTAEEVCFGAGIREVTLVESILAAAVGCDLPVTSHDGCFIVNIGGGTTEIAAIALGGIVHGVSVDVGGVKMDSDIMDYVLNKHHLQVGLATIDRVKSEIGSLFSNDTASAVVSGQDVTTRAPASCTVTARDFMAAMLPAYHAIADAVESVINLCPPETSANIYKSGVVLTGGAAKVLGLEQLFNGRLHLANYVAPDPEYACIVGGGKLIKDVDLLHRILEQN